MANENYQNKEKKGFEQFLIKNKKMVSIVGGAAIVLVLGIFAYIYLYAKPHNEESKEVWWKAAVYLEKDSLNLAITGGPTFTGFQSVAKNYSGTYGGNIANYGIGVAYLNMQEFGIALKFLKNCEFEDIILQSMAKGAMGDAFWELGQTGKAEKKYLEAIEAEPDLFTTPFYLMKLGLLNELSENPSKAAEYYKQIKNDWEGSAQYKDIDKYIARAENQ